MGPNILLLEVREEPRSLLAESTVVTGGRAASVEPCTEEVAVLVGGRLVAGHAASGWEWGNVRAGVEGSEGRAWRAIED